MGACHAFATRLPLNEGRRGHLRFPISMPAELVCNGRKSSARTLNLGSHGVYVLTGEDLTVGKLVRLSIEWPAKLDGRCPLTLFILGHIVRLDTYGAAVRIEKYEFRLRPKTAALRAADPDKHDAK